MPAVLDRKSEITILPNLTYSLKCNHYQSFNDTDTEKSTTRVFHGYVIDPPEEPKKFCTDRVKLESLNYLTSRYTPG